jgi:hypothetical protein
MVVTKRPTTAFVGRNDRQTDAKSRESMDGREAARIVRICCKFDELGRQGSTSENRGVPGSSPGLATAESRMGAGFSISRSGPLHPRLGTRLGTDAPMAVDRSGAESQE